MVFSFNFKDYHPAASHPCLYPRLIPGKKRKRGDENEALEPFWHWYLIREFSGHVLKPKARPFIPQAENGKVALATFSSLLVRHVAEMRGRQLKVPQRKGVRFLITPGETAEQNVAVTKATYLRSKAPTAAWTKGEGSSQVDNMAMGMTTYGEGGQLKAEKTSVFLASAGGEAVKVENCTVEGVRGMLSSE